MQEEHDLLEIQKKMIRVFRELEEINEKLFSRSVQLGWKQRNALVNQVYSGHNKHEQLQAAREEWEAACAVHQVHKKLYDLFREYRDLYGYFPEYHEMREEMNDHLQTAVAREEYEKAGILKKWMDKLPEIK